GVIQVVRRYAADRVKNLLPFFRIHPKRPGQLENHAADVLMLRDQQFDVLPPGGFGRIDRPLEKVAARDRKTAALLARESAAHQVFNIRRVFLELPNIVSSGGRAPCGLSRAYAADRRPEIGPVPRLLIEGFIEELEQQRNLGMRCRGHGSNQYIGPLHGTMSVMYGIEPARYTCYRAAGPIAIDGKLDEPSWRMASKSAPF